MAHEIAFRRVVVLCDGACDIANAVREAASLAARWGVQLRGIYVEDESLRRLAALPFGQEVSLSSANFSQALSTEKVEALSTSIAAGMQRALSEAAHALGIDWSFGSTPDLPSVAQMAEAADMILVEAAARAFSGAWRPRSVLEQGLAALPATALIRVRRHEGKGVMVVLPAAETDWDKVLAATAAMVASSEPIVVLVPDGAGVDKTVQGLIAAYGLRKATVEKRAGDGAALLHRIAARNPALVVLDAEAGLAEAAQSLIADARRDVLIVR
jgi:hypothetical protein